MAARVAARGDRSKDNSESVARSLYCIHVCLILVSAFNAANED